jgi:hypothetical protein
MWGVHWFFLVVPSLASVCVISFPMMPECACILCMWVFLCGVQYVCRIIATINGLSGWWWRDVGFGYDCLLNICS